MQRPLEVLFPPAHAQIRKHWIAALLLCLLALLGSLRGAGAAPPPGHSLHFDSALSLVGAASEQKFPTDRVANPVRLPDDWWVSRPREEGPIWYRIQFDAPPGSAAPWGLLIKRVCNSADVQINGVLIHRGSLLDDAASRRCDQSRLLSLPAELLTAHGNSLDLKVSGRELQSVAARQRSGGLSDIELAPYHLLARGQAATDFWSQSLWSILTVASTAIGLLVLWFGWNYHHEPRLIYLGMLILAWNLFNARTLVAYLPFDSATVEMTVCVGYAFITALAVQFMLSQGGLRSRTLEAFLFLQCLAVPLSLAVAGFNRLFLAASAWHLLLELEVIATMALYLYTFWHSRKPHFWRAVAGLGGLASVVLVEQLGQMTFLYPLRLAVVPLLMPLVLAWLGAWHLQGFVRALRAAETRSRGLEERMADAAHEMERNYAQMVETRVEQVVEKERKRIAGDLHDDLGAKLLTIVHTSESERISSLARDALEEMRLSVKGLTGRPLPVANALADWRAETVLRLGQAGVEADWRSPTEDLTQQLSARAFVQTTRILREAVSNVIKHSGASHCKIRCSLGEHDFVLVIQDNGKGIPMELDGKLDRGHGMASMKHRAKQMQGQCLVESGPGYGTVIRLTLPL